MVPCEEVTRRYAAEQSQVRVVQPSKTDLLWLHLLLVQLQMLRGSKFALATLGSD